MVNRFFVACLMVTVCVSASLSLTAADPATPPAGKAPAKPTRPEEDYYQLMKLFVDSFEQIEKNYVKEVDRRVLFEAALEGMMEKLDPYSNYIGPEEISRFNAQVEQEFGGIGIQIHIPENTKRLTVMTPLPGTPAYRAGLRAGDQILEIEHKSTENIKLDDAVRTLKGKPGETVTLGILHQGGSMVEQVVLTREIIHVATALGDAYKPDGHWNFMLDPEKKIGYIRLSAFSRNTARELHEALDELKKEGMKGLILDLRFNPGGLLSAAVEISDMFIESGKIVSTKGRNTDERVWEATKPNTYSGFPMAVLINRYSASASEIVSACLQDHNRAKIIGERSWGKGSVQNVIELEGGKSAMKLTTASYHRPSGKNIHRFPGAKETDEWGVMPDDGFKVVNSLGELENYLIYRKERDVLSKDGPPKSDFKDSQLNKAVEYINAQLQAPAKPADAKPEAPGKTEPNAPATDKKASLNPPHPKQLGRWWKAHTPIDLG
ncbi:MAG: S41 family peptidase [Planctomycetales bacterium]